MYPLQKLILTHSQAADGLFPLSFLVKKKMTELHLIAQHQPLLSSLIHYVGGTQCESKFLWVSWWLIEADKAVQSDTEFSFLCTSSKAVQGIDALDNSVKSY